MWQKTAAGITNVVLFFFYFYNCPLLLFHPHCANEPTAYHLFSKLSSCFTNYRYLELTAVSSGIAIPAEVFSYHKSWVGELHKELGCVLC